MTDITSQFSQHELANFKAAFDVFDINQDGKISTDEIFQVLGTMGNEVSPERKEKIHKAVQEVLGGHVEADSSLEMHHFIKFMGLMQEINEQERRQNTALAPGTSMQRLPLSVDDGGGSKDHIKYGGCIPIARRDPVQSVCARLNTVLVWLVFAFQAVYYLYVSVVEVAEQFDSGDWDFIMRLNPRDRNVDSVSDCHTPNACDSRDHVYGEYLHYLRILNLLNLVLLIKLMIRIGADDYGRLRTLNYDEAPQNLLRYHARPLFAWNLVANVIWFIGFREGADSGFLSVPTYHYILPAVQIVTMYFILSPFWWLDHTKGVPANACESVKVFFVDLFLLNWIRLLATLFMDIVSLVLMPFVILYTVFAAFARLCCASKFDWNARPSFTYSCVHLNDVLNIDGFASLFQL